MRFSSDDIPPEMRAQAIESAFGAHVQGMVDFADDEPVRVDMGLRGLASIHIARIDASPLRLITPSDDNGLLYLSITASGGGLIDARGEGRTVKAGDVNVMRRDRQCTTVVAEHSTILSIAMPRATLVPRLGSIDSLYAPQVHSLPAARLLESYAQALLDDGTDLSMEEQSVFAGHLVDLAILTLGARRDDAHEATKGGVRAARRRAVKADIAAHLDLPELSVEWMAKRHTVSPATIRALFYDEGTSFTDYVLSERLSHVRALLTSPYLAHHNIATLALMAGFNDITWFNQAFRRRFGMRPSDLRAGQTH
jgi:AraC-like DNA-binding protein